MTDLAALVDRPGDWHLHTDYTDGQATVADYCERAVANGLEFLVFSEHVRRRLDYDYGALRTDVEAARETFDLTILLGCEAKTLDTDGRIDAPPAVTSVADVVTGVFHSFDGDREDYLRAAAAMLRNPAVDVWGHPLLFAERRGYELTDAELSGLMAAAAEGGVLLERNRRYGLPPSRLVAVAPDYGVDFVVGSDAHGVSRLLTKERLAYERAWLAQQS
ncbi:PHP domain-containing protein [Halorarius halobius]|uniref:PHP domain-containing protein n=1 Tax=Halorarius halobius TaxID=2962671 RepID=UPI0020CC7F6A|nr:PHP domain-containing protein [Halorarius halobius]